MSIPASCISMYLRDDNTLGAMSVGESPTRRSGVRMLLTMSSAGMVIAAMFVHLAALAI